MEFLWENGSLWNGVNFEFWLPCVLLVHMVKLPYRQIAVASTFSPRFLAVLAEAFRVAARFGSKCGVIHAASHSREREAKFLNAFEELHIHPIPFLHWAEGSVPTDAILNAAVRADVDLLIAGVVGSSEDTRSFLSDVARQLLDRSFCDLFLLPRPSREETPVETAVVAADPTVDLTWIRGMIPCLEQMGFSKVFLVGMVNPFSMALVDSREQTVDSFWEKLEAAAGTPQCEVEVQILESNTGFSLCEFVQARDSHLLAIPTERVGDSKHLPAHMDWIQQVIPSPVWLVDRERLKRIVPYSQSTIK